MNHKPQMDTVEVPGEQSTYSLAGVKPLRALEVLACSTKLARLDMRYNATGGEIHTLLNLQNGGTEDSLLNGYIVLFGSQVN